MRRQQASESASAWLTASGKVYDEFIPPSWLEGLFFFPTGHMLQIDKAAWMVLGGDFLRHRKECRISRVVALGGGLVSR